MITTIPTIKLFGKKFILNVEKECRVKCCPTKFNININYDFRLNQKFITYDLAKTEDLKLLLLIPVFFLSF